MAERDFIGATRERVVVFDGGMGATGTGGSSAIERPRGGEPDERRDFVATVLGLIFVPLFFVLISRVFSRRQRAAAETLVVAQAQGDA